MIGGGHDHGTIGGISQDPIGIKVKGINSECDQSGGGHCERYVVVTKVMGHGVGAHDSKDKEI